MVLEEYIQQGEPEQVEKSEAWQIAIGLQQVDGLNISTYLLGIAKEHIAGKITIYEVQKLILSYYQEHCNRIENNTKEADIVSARVTQLLEEKTYKFSPVELMSIHRCLFDGVFENAGEIRNYNISKKEWVLNGDTVIYTSWNGLKDVLDYEFKMEKSFSYEKLPLSEIIKHFASFTSDIWQIHPFGEGNTRTIAVFIIKYLRTIGLEINGEVFKKHSWFFRNALVRANYNDFPNGVYTTNKFLEMFFSNLLLGSNYELKNRYMHIGYDLMRHLK